MTQFFDLGDRQKISAWVSLDYRFSLRLDIPQGAYRLPHPVTPTEMLRITSLLNEDNPDEFVDIGQTRFACNQVGANQTALLLVGKYSRAYAIFDTAKKEPLHNFLHHQLRGFRQLGIVGDIGTTTVATTSDHIEDGTFVGLQIWQTPGGLQLNFTAGDTAGNLAVDGLENSDLWKLADWAMKSTGTPDLLTLITAVTQIAGTEFKTSWNSTQDEPTALEVSITTPDKRWIWDATPAELELLATLLTGVAVDQEQREATA